MKNLKLISTILLSIMLIFTISTAVFADDENNDIWSEPTVGENNTTENNVIENNTTENNSTENNSTENNSFDNINVDDNTNDNVKYNNLYNTTNNTSTTSDSENLAKTGIEDSGVISLIIIVSAVVAIYSAIRFNEYKNV